MFKKALALLILCTIMLSAACVGSPTDGGYETDEESPLAYAEFRFGILPGGYLNPTMGQTNIGDAILARYEKMKTVHNLDIIIETCELKSDVVTKRLAVMQELFDIYETAPRYVGLSSYEKGVLYALEDIPTIDANSEKWGYKNQISSARFSDGKYYGFFPNEWPYAPTFEGLMHFNTQILRSLGMTLPYEYYEQKSWNWEVFEGLLKEIKESGFAADIKPWTAVSFNEDAVNMMFINGMSSISKNHQGEYQFGFDCPAGIEVLEFMNNMYVNGLYYCNSTAFTQDYTSVFFSSASGGTVSASSTIGSETLATQVPEFGIITYPYGPSGSPDNVSANINWSSVNYFIFNVTDNEAETIGIFMEELFSPLDGVTSWQEYLQNDIFHNSKDFEYYVDMLKNCNNDNSTYYGNSSLLLDGYFAKAVRGEIAAAQVFESIRETIQTEIKKTTQNAVFDLSES